MPIQIAPIGSHPPGEPNSSVFSGRQTSTALEPASVPLDVHGKRIYVEWDPYAPVTPLGQLVYFSQFLASAGLFKNWVGDCPLHYDSPNAPSLNDLLGTITLSILAGNRRYAHVTALRGDTVNPQGLGMSRVLSEDAVRRAFAKEEAGPLENWQREHLWRSVEPVLKAPWICDIDVTVKTIYGRQEGAEVGYNPHKPGRPAHAYHTFFISRLRLALDVVVAPGKQFHSRAVSQRFWQWWEKLSAQHRPYLLRGDCGFGNENFLSGMRETQAPAALFVSLAPEQGRGAAGRKAQRPGWMERVRARLARDGTSAVLAGVEPSPAGDRAAAASSSSGKGTDRGRGEAAVGSGGVRSL